MIPTRHESHRVIIAQASYDLIFTHTTYNIIAMRQFDPRKPLPNPYADHEPDLLPDDDWDIDRSDIEAIGRGTTLPGKLARIKPRQPRKPKYARGRPFQIAYIPPGIESTDMAYLKAFISIMQQVDYKEITAISYALHRHRETVRRWKYGYHFPGYDSIFWIVDWYRHGRKTYTGHHGQHMI